MSPIRKDGLAIRDLQEDKYLTFVMNKKFYQLYNGGLDEILLDGHTLYLDQFLLMPGKLFHDWSEE